MCGVCVPIVCGHVCAPCVGVREHLCVCFAPPCPCFSLPCAPAPWPTGSGKVGVTGRGGRSAPTRPFHRPAAYRCPSSGCPWLPLRRPSSAPRCLGALWEQDGVSGSRARDPLGSLLGCLRPQAPAAGPAGTESGVSGGVGGSGWPGLQLWSPCRPSPAGGEWSQPSCAGRRREPGKGGARPLAPGRPQRVGCPMARGRTKTGFVGGGHGRREAPRRDLAETQNPRPEPATQVRPGEGGQEPVLGGRGRRGHRACLLQAARCLTRASGVSLWGQGLRGQGSGVRARGSASGVSLWGQGLQGQDLWVQAEPQPSLPGSGAGALQWPGLLACACQGPPTLGPRLCFVGVQGGAPVSPVGPGALGSRLAWAASCWTFRDRPPALGMRDLPSLGPVSLRLSICPSVHRPQTRSPSSLPPRAPCPTERTQSRASPLGPSPAPRERLQAGPSRRGDRPLCPGAHGSPEKGLPATGVHVPLTRAHPHHP